MASGDTLLIFLPSAAEFPSSNYATFNTRNNHLVLEFDTTTQETCYFSAVMPRSYSGNGVTPYVHWAAASATSGTIGWDISFERIGSAQQDIDSDGFATAQTVTAATVDGTSGNVSVTNVAISNGANMDSVAAGEAFRLRIRRDVSNDNATGDAQLLAVELKET